MGASMKVMDVPYHIRRAIGASFAVFISAVLVDYYSFTHEGWMILSCFLVCQTTRGTPLRQGLSLLLSILLALLFVSLISYFNNDILTQIICASAYILIAWLVFINRPYINRPFYQGLFFGIVILLVLFMPTTSSLHNRVLDSLLGGMIAILMMRLFSIRIEQAFRQGITPILQLLIDYNDLLIRCLHHNANLTALTNKKNEIESVLQAYSSDYPEWVYEVGFNPGLRSGFRFFLIQLERVIECYFSMHYLVSTFDLGELTEGMLDEVVNSIQNNRELLSVLIFYLDKKELLKSDANYIDDIKALESALGNTLPYHIDLLEISSQSLSLLAFVRDIKDSRDLLLQLVMSLPNE